jgi:cation diffusion facilitator family transporter
VPELGSSRSAAVRRVLWGILLANLAVVGAKVVIGFAAGSLAVLGDAIHSTADAMNNVLALVVVRAAAKPPDEDHPYGHGKFETLGTLAIVGFMSITCFELVRDAIGRLLAARTPPRLSDLQLAILLVTLAVNVFVAWYEHRRGEQLQNDLLLADAAHTRADVFITIGVVTGMLVARRGWWWVDPVLALAIAMLIVRIGYKIFQHALPVLVDERATPTATIQSLAESVAGVRGAYGIRSRGGSRSHVRYAEVTIAVDGSANVADAHVIADRVEALLKRDLELTEVTVHVEPC